MNMFAKIWGVETISMTWFGQCEGCHLGSFLRISRVVVEVEELEAHDIFIKIFYRSIWSINTNTQLMSKIKRD